MNVFKDYPRDILRALADGPRIRLSDSPASHGLYGLRDHMGEIRYIGITESPAMGFKRRINSYMRPANFAARLSSGARRQIMSFEIIYITEGPEATPAAEIQFNGQRLCIVRLLSTDTPHIEFLTDLYVGRDVRMTFPYSQFHDQVQLAADDLASWQANLASGRTGV